MTKSKMKVLIVTPIDERKYYCFSDYMAGVLAQNADILLIDTSANGFYKDKIGDRILYKRMRYIPKQFMDRVVKARNMGSEYAIKNNYDAVFWVDSDIILEPGTLDRLAGYNLQVVAGVYKSIDGRYVHNVFEENKLIVMKEKHLNKGLIDAVHIGFGCTFTNIELLKKVKFRCEREKNGLIKKGEDYCFGVDCYTEHGIIPKVDTGLVVKHVPASRWDLERI